MNAINSIYPIYYSEAETCTPPSPVAPTRGLATLAVLAFMATSVPEAGVVPFTEIAPFEDRQGDLSLADVVEHFAHSLPRAHRRDAYRLGKLVLELSERHQISPALILAVVETESSFRSTVVSSAGAVGLMQLLPGTARELATRYKVRAYHNAKDLRDPAINLRLGVAYLAQLRHQFGHSLHYLAAYNLGPTAFHRRLSSSNYELGSLDHYVRAIHERARHIRGSRAARQWPQLKREEALLAASL